METVFTRLYLLSYARARLFGAGDGVASRGGGLRRANGPVRGPWTAPPDRPRPTSRPRSRRGLLGLMCVAWNLTHFAIAHLGEEGASSRLEGYLGRLGDMLGGVDLLYRERAYEVVPTLEYVRVKL